MQAFKLRSLTPIEPVLDLEPEVLELAPVPVAPAVRVGDLLRAADSLRLALELAEVATTVAARAGAPPATVAALQRQIRALRTSP